MGALRCTVTAFWLIALCMKCVSGQYMTGFSFFITAIIRRAAILVTCFWERRPTTSLTLKAKSARREVIEMAHERILSAVREAHPTELPRFPNVVEAKEMDERS